MSLEDRGGQNRQAVSELKVDNRKSRLNTKLILTGIGLFATGLIANIINPDDVSNTIKTIEASGMGAGILIYAIGMIRVISFNRDFNKRRDQISNEDNQIQEKYRGNKRQ